MWGFLCLLVIQSDIKQNKCYDYSLGGVGWEGINFILFLNNYGNCWNRPLHVNYVKTLIFKEGMSRHHRVHRRGAMELIGGRGNCWTEFMEEHESMSDIIKIQYDCWLILIQVQKKICVFWKENCFLCYCLLFTSISSFGELMRSARLHWELAVGPE